MSKKAINHCKETLINIIKKGMKAQIMSKKAINHCKETLINIKVKTTKINESLQNSNKPNQCSKRNSSMDRKKIYTQYENPNKLLANIYKYIQKIYIVT